MAGKVNLSKIFILRPVATTLLGIAIMLAGAVAYFQLPVSALPEVDYPTIQVLTFYPGASPDVVATGITAPLEVQFGQMAGLKQMRSTSSYGCSVIVLQFDLDLNIDVGEQEVQEAINAASSFLPNDLPNPPVYSKVNPADPPILTLAISSKTIPLTQVEDLADTRLAQKISQLSGVGLVSISGGQIPSVRIQANPLALAAYGLTLESLRSSIEAANINQAKGSFDGPKQSSVIGTNDQLFTPEEYKSLIIAYSKGAPVRISDIADVVSAPEDINQAAWMNETPAVIVNIQRQPGYNVIAVVNRIKEMLPQLTSSLPSSIEVKILTDRTVTIRASVSDVQFELLLSIALVIAVIFIFLRTMAATIIPSVAIPLSLVGTLGVMYILGFSLNNLSLMSLIIATGFVVDDAIVMVENIARYIEEGKSPMDAALEGSGQMAFTILSLSISLIAVLIPLLFMGDLVGRLFREFAITLAATIMISAVVSLTITPMMSARLLKFKPESERGKFYHITQKGIDSVIYFYGITLRWVLKHQKLTIIVAICTLLLTIVLFYIAPKGFFPVQDTGLLLGMSEAAQEISFPEMAKHQQQLSKIILKDPAVESLSSFIGIDGTNTTLNSGRIMINLKPIDVRKLDATEVIHRLEPELAKIKGITLYMQPVQDITVDDTVSRTQYQYTLDDPNPDELNIWAPKFVAALKKIPELRDVNSDMQNNGMKAQVTIDRDTASRLGISTESIDDTLYSAFGQRQISTIFTQLNQYHVILEVKPEFQQRPGDLKDIYLTSGSGGQVPLSVITNTKVTNTPLVISHLGQFPAVTISFNLAQNASLGDAVKEINKTADELGMPASIHGSFQGTAQAFEASLANEPILILAALIAVYIVLGILYESFIHPITILSTLPSAGVGAIMALLLCKMNLSIIALIGIILLIGIVQKNGIMMVDFALEEERTKGKSSHEAIYHACLLRFRPILMTTMAAMLGALPLFLSSGIGSELRRPLGATIIGGLIFSQVLTLYTTPVIYLWFCRLSKKINGTSSPSEK
ncbi:MAG: multidrug efflux RND transporter permease subunit [Lentisphaerota bacterium]